MQSSTKTTLIGVRLKLSNSVLFLKHWIYVNTCWYSLTDVNPSTHSIPKLYQCIRTLWTLLISIIQTFTKHWRFVERWKQMFMTLKIKCLAQCQSNARTTYWFYRRLYHLKLHQWMWTLETIAIIVNKYAAKKSRHYKTMIVDQTIASNMTAPHANGQWNNQQHNGRSDNCCRTRTEMAYYECMSKSYPINFSFCAVLFWFVGKDVKENRRSKMSFTHTTQHWHYWEYRLWSFVKVTIPWNLF